MPGSWQVREQIEEEGLDEILREAGFELRQPGCSACLAMNEDKVPAGKYASPRRTATSRGDKEGSRTILAAAGGSRGGGQQEDHGAVNKDREKLL